MAESGWDYLWQKHSVGVCKLGGNPGLAFNFTRDTDGILAIDCCVPLFFLF